MADQAPLPVDQPPIPIPILTLKNSLIRHYHPADSELIAPLANNTTVTRFLRSTFPSPYTVDASRAWVAACIAKDPSYEFVIVSTKPPKNTTSAPTTNPFDPDPTHHIAGAIGLSPRPETEGTTYEVGYWLGEPFWGTGIMGETCAALTEWAFSEKGIPGLVRLQAEVIGGNWGSAKVLERAGFVLEGVRRKGWCKGGEVRDALDYGVTREDLEARRRGETVVVRGGGSAFEEGKVVV